MPYCCFVNKFVSYIYDYKSACTGAYEDPFSMLCSSAKCCEVSITFINFIEFDMHKNMDSSPKKKVSKLYKILSLWNEI